MKIHPISWFTRNDGGLDCLYYDLFGKVGKAETDLALEDIEFKLYEWLYLDNGKISNADPYDVGPMPPKSPEVCAYWEISDDDSKACCILESSSKSNTFLITRDIHDTDRIDELVEVILLDDDSTVKGMMREIFTESEVTRSFSYNGYLEIPEDIVQIKLDVYLDRFQSGVPGLNFEYMICTVLGKTCPNLKTANGLVSGAKILSDLDSKMMIYNSLIDVANVSKLTVQNLLYLSDDEILDKIIPSGNTYIPIDILMKKVGVHRYVYRLDYRPLIMNAYVESDDANLFNIAEVLPTRLSLRILFNTITHENTRKIFRSSIMKLKNHMEIIEINLDAMFVVYNSIDEMDKTHMVIRKEDYKTYEIY